MKNSKIILATGALILVSFVVGIRVGAVYVSLRHSTQITQRGSKAGQTLFDLSGALEDERNAKGAYPDSIKTLKVTQSNGDFSETLLHEIKYYKTIDGYVAFVGLPNVVYCDPQTGLHFNGNSTEPGDPPNTHSPSALGVGGR